MTWSAPSHYLSQCCHVFIRPQLICCNEITFCLAFNKMHLEMPSATYRPLYIGINVLKLLFCWCDSIHFHRIYKSVSHLIRYFIQKRRIRNVGQTLHSLKYPLILVCSPESKVHGAIMGPTRALSASDWPHVGPINISMRVRISSFDIDPQ